MHSLAAASAGVPPLPCVAAAVALAPAAAGSVAAPPVAVAATPVEGSTSETW